MGVNHAAVPVGLLSASNKIAAWSAVVLAAAARRPVSTGPESRRSPGLPRGVRWRAGHFIDAERHVRGDGVQSIALQRMAMAGPAGFPSALSPGTLGKAVVMMPFVAARMGFAHLKRRKRGNPPFGGAGRRGVPAYQCCRRTVINPRTPATGGDAPARCCPRRSATACRTRRRPRWAMGRSCCRMWAARAVQEKRPSRTVVVRPIARSDHWRWVSKPSWVRTSWTSLPRARHLTGECNGLFRRGHGG